MLVFARARLRRQNGRVSPPTVLIRITCILHIITDAHARACMYTPPPHVVDGNFSRYLGFFFFFNRWRRSSAGDYNARARRVRFHGGTISERRRNFVLVVRDGNQHVRNTFDPAEDECLQV